MSLASKLNKWVAAGLITADQAAQITKTEKSGNGNRITWALGGLGTLSIILGILSLIAANWHKTGPEFKIIGHLLLNLSLAGGIFFFLPRPTWLREILVTVLAGLCLTFIALTGQILQTEAPMWQAIGIWLLLTTPMMFVWTRAAWPIAGWIVMMLVFFALLINSPLSQNALAIIWSSIPFAFLGLARTKSIHTIMPEWSRIWDRFFWIILAISTMFTQMLWTDSFVYIPKDLYFTALAIAAMGTLIVVLLEMFQKNNVISFWRPAQKEWIYLLIVSITFIAAPALIPHHKWSVVGALSFCAYWGILGTIGLRTNREALWSMAMFVISVRIFILYIEVLGSLATQGFGFIITGLIVIALAGTTRKLMKQRPEWLMPTTKTGGAS